ncbi:MAG: TfoX/Sxy family protein [Chloroflexi bacterium]|nr:TfoX/Sxy family protein [Chloroflexota bacterium]
MAYDEGLAQRVRELLDEQPGNVEKKMFGGVGFIIHGNMACGVHKNALVVRVGPERYQDTLAKPYTREFDITGRPMKGWVMVASDGYETDEVLKDWVQQGVEFALSLPPK